MIIDLQDPRVDAAIAYVKQKHGIVDTSDSVEFVRIFENEYHCKIEMDPYGIAGHLYVSDNKYQSWFLLNFS